MSENLADSNQRAFAQLTSAEPVLTDIAPAADLLPGMTATTVLHAGPPVEWSAMCGPMRGAVWAALIYEGLASDIEDADRLASSGEIDFQPCHAFGAVGPMTGVTTASMPLWVVEDRRSGRRAFSTINEGSGNVIRFGAHEESTVERLKWIERVAAPLLANSLRRMGGMEIGPLMSQALAMGDELHMRNLASTSLFVKQIMGPLSESLSEPGVDEVLRFLTTGNDQFFLNIAMAANKLAADCADGQSGSTLVTAIARNGVEVGVRISGLPGRWFTAPAPTVEGLYFPGYSVADACPDIGDSAIMETGGFGGCAMAAAPGIVRFLGAERSAIALQTTLEMYEITIGEHGQYLIPSLDFRGTPAGIDAVRVVETGLTPALNTAIAAGKPGIGMIGAGMGRVPIGCFEQALMALDADQSNQESRS